MDETEYWRRVVSALEGMTEEEKLNYLERLEKGGEAGQSRLEASDSR